MMLIQPSPPPPNPHHPFVYLNGEIRHVGDLGDRYEADVWSGHNRWCWFAKFTAIDGTATYPNDEGAPMYAPTEEQATADAVTWLRARCVAVHGRCG